MVFDRYVSRSTKEVVTVMKYNDINDFDKLVEFIGDVYPTLSKAQTRIFENNWVVRHQNNAVTFMCCAHNEKCFENAYEPYK